MSVCECAWTSANELEKLAQLENSLNKLNWFELLHSIVAHIRSILTPHSHTDWICNWFIYLFIAAVRANFPFRTHSQCAALNWIFDNNCEKTRVCTRALWVIAFVLIHIRANFAFILLIVLVSCTRECTNVRMYSLSTSVDSLSLSLPVSVPILKRFVHSRFALLSPLLLPYTRD